MRRRVRAGKPRGPDSGLAVPRCAAQTRRREPSFSRHGGQRHVARQHESILHPQGGAHRSGRRGAASGPGRAARRARHVRRQEAAAAKLRHFARGRVRRRTPARGLPARPHQRRSAGGRTRSSRARGCRSRRGAARAGRAGQGRHQDAVPFGRPHRPQHRLVTADAAAASRAPHVERDRHLCRARRQHLLAAAGKCRGGGAGCGSVGRRNRVARR